MNKSERIATMAPLYCSRYRAAIIKYLEGCNKHVRASDVMEAIGIRLDYRLLGAMLALLVESEEIRKDPNGKYYVDKLILPWKTGFPKHRLKGRIVAFADDWHPQRNDAPASGVVRMGSSMALLEAL